MFGDEKNLVFQTLIGHDMLLFQRIKSTQQAFTLIEMLVVISIIAVLLAMLLPTLGSARDSIRTVQCLSNLRQISVLFQTYTDESNGYLPAIWNFNPLDTGTTGVSPYSTPWSVQIRAFSPFP